MSNYLTCGVCDAEYPDHETHACPGRSSAPVLERIEAVLRDMERTCAVYDGQRLIAASHLYAAIWSRNLGHDDKEIAVKVASIVRDLEHELGPEGST